MPVRSGPIFPPTILSFRFSVGFDFQSSLLRDRRYHSPLCGQTFSMSSIPQSSSDATRHSANTFALCFNGLYTLFGSSMVFAPPSVPPLSGDRNVIGGQKRCSFGLSIFDASPLSNRSIFSDLFSVLILYPMANQKLPFASRFYNRQTVYIIIMSAISREVPLPNHQGIP